MPKFPKRLVFKAKKKQTESRKTTDNHSYYETKRERLSWSTFTFNFFQNKYTNATLYLY